MRLITRHILRALAAPFLWGIVALTGLLLLNQISELINQFGGKGLGLDVMLEAVVLALPALLTLTLPMAVLVSTLYAYSQLAADQEMVAMYANGISVWRMVRPALVATVAVAMVNFVLFDQIVPRSNIRFRALKIDVMNKTPTLALRPVLLNPLPPTAYILRATSIDGATGEMRDVTIYDLSSFDGRRVMHAKSGRMAQSPNGTDLLLTLREGDQLDIKSNETGRIERTRFQENRIRIRNVANELERRDDEHERGDREMSGCQLLDGVSDQEWLLADMNRQREYATRRDLRHLAGLSPATAPAAQLLPKFPPHCGKYRLIEAWFGRLLIPGMKKATDSAPPVADIMKGRSQRPVDSVPERARLPLGGVAVTPPMPQPAAIVEPVPAPAEAPPARPTDSALVRPDSAAPTDSALAILTAVVPPEEHTPSTDSALALALRQPTSDSAPVPPAATELMPLLDTTNRGFLVPPQGTGPSSGLVGTIEEVRGTTIAANRALSQIRQFQVEFHKKFAIPLASFCFVLLGVALALKYPRSGIGLVIAASLIIFMTYYVLLIGGENIANKGYISPAAAMHGPVILFTLLGLAGIAAANREMGTARTSGILDSLLALIQRTFQRAS
jgi:lipopolysaccharide export system permease protein